MLASMSQIDRRADAPLVDWSELGVSGLLPTGTVTLLLADVEGSTRLWQTQPEQMTAAFTRLDHALSDLLAAHGGVRPMEQGEGDRRLSCSRRSGDGRPSGWRRTESDVTPSTWITPAWRGKYPVGVEHPRPREAAGEERPGRVWCGPATLERRAAIR
jgi:hypothetical protein